MSDFSSVERKEELFRKLDATSGRSRLNDRELLELLLCFAVPNRDTGILASQLLKRFGSLSEVLDANAEDLSRIEGISTAAAALVALIPKLAGRAAAEAPMQQSDDAVMESLSRFAARCFIGNTVEHFLLLSLDNNKTIIDRKFISYGTVNNSIVDMRRIVRELLDNHGRYAFVAHNHPRGEPHPSRDDIIATNTLKSMLEHIDVTLLDHIIVCSDCYYSICTQKITKRTDTYFGSSSN